MENSMEDKLNLRFMQECDIPDVIEAERQANNGILQPWILGASGIRKIAQTQRNDKLGTYDSRSMVLEMPVQGIVEHNPNRWVTWVCGAFAYELQPTGYELLYTIIHPDVNHEKALQLICIYMVGKADHSPNRQYVVTYLRDNDEAGLRTFLPFWKSRGFICSLCPNYYENGTDAWKLLYKSETPSEDRDRKDNDKQMA